MIEQFHLKKFFLRQVDAIFFFNETSYPLNLCIVIKIR